MTGKRYPASTVAQILAIPEDGGVRARFFAEFPAALREIQNILDAADDMGARIKAASPWPFRWLPVSFHAAMIRQQIVTKAEWVDDDKGTITVSVAVKEGGPTFFEQRETL